VAFVGLRVAGTLAGNNPSHFTNVEVDGNTTIHSNLAVDADGIIEENMVVDGNLTISTATAKGPTPGSSDHRCNQGHIWGNYNCSSMR
jgi:hypothetical protein